MGYYRPTSRPPFRLALGLAVVLVMLVVALVASVFALSVTRILLGVVDSLSEGVVSYTMGTNIAGLGAQLAIVNIEGVANPAIVLLFSLVILAAALAVVLSVGTYFSAWHQHGHRSVDAGAIALVVASAGALALRRRYPVAVLALVFGTTLIYFVLGYASGPIWLALIVAYYTATACGHRLAAVIAAVAGLAGWRGALPPNPMKGPRLMPWRMIMVFAAATAIGLLGFSLRAM